MIHSSTIDAVRNYDDIVAVIGGYVSLKKRGRSHIGLCPFHSEKTPSFYVSQEKKMFHCFGCKASGDLIAFMMQYDGLNFTEAVKAIAEKAGVEVKETEKTGKDYKKDQERDRVRALLVDAKEWFQNQLIQMPQAQKYLSDRGVTPDIIQRFGIGYAPSRNQAATVFKNKGYSPFEMTQSGLFYLDESESLKFRFWDRIVFPVLDHLGKTVGFGGRALRANKQIAKYINSPDSLVFNKSRLLYGLNLAKMPLKENKTAILMEGYMDVVIAHQFGFQTSMASMGTALTSMQAQLIKRYADTVILAMDSDQAGQSATITNYDVLKEAGLQVRVIQFNEKDPADYLMAHGEASFQTLLETPQSMMEFQFERLKSTTNLADIEQVSRLVQDIVPYLKAETDPIIQKHYVSKIAKELKVERELIMAKMKNNRYNAKSKKFKPMSPNKTKFQKAEEIVLYVAITSIEEREKIKGSIQFNDFITPQYQVLFKQIIDSKKVNHHFITELKEAASQVELTQIIMRFEQEVEEKIIKYQWKDCIWVLKQYKIENRIREIKEELASPEIDEEAETKLLSELSILINTKQIEVTL